MGKHSFAAVEFCCVAKLFRFRIPAVCDAIKNDTETHIRVFININLNKSKACDS